MTIKVFVPRRSLAVLALILLAQCRTAPFEALDRSTLPRPDDHPDIDAVVLLDEEVIEFALDGETPVATQTDRKRMVVLTEDGQNLGDFGTSYSATFSKLMSVDVRITPPEGEPKDYTLEDMRDYPAIHNGLYDDLRVVVLDVPAVPIGTVVETVAVRRSLNPSYFTSRFVFGSRYPVRRASFRVFEPAGWKLGHRASRAWAPIEQPPREEVTGDGRWLIWEQEDIARTKPEEYAPGVWDREPVVSVRIDRWVDDGGAEKSNFDSIESFGKFLHELQSGTAEPTPEIRAQVKEILASAPKDPRVRAKMLYEWVQENVRYVAVEVGMGGWRPYPAAETFKTRHGDCKDKATLLKTMLAVDGIESHLASLYAHGGTPRKYMIPGLGQSNHAILAIELGDELLIADPTTRTVPFGELPVSDQEAELLLVKATGGELYPSPASSADDNEKKLRLTLTASEDGAAKGQVTLETTGAFAASLRRNLIVTSEEDSKDAVKGWAWLRSGHVENAKFDEGARDGRLIVNATGEVELDEVGRDVADARLISLAELLYTPGRQLTSSERVGPVVFDKRERRDTEVKIVIPKGWTVSTLPEPETVESPFGRYSQSWRHEGDTLIATSDYRLDERVFEAERYGELDAFFDAITAARSRPVVVRLK